RSDMPRSTESDCAPGYFVLMTALTKRWAAGGPGRSGERLFGAAIRGRAGIAVGRVRGVRSAAGWRHHPLAGKSGIGGALRRCGPEWPEEKQGHQGQHSTEAQESSVCSNHTAATRSL